MPDPLLPEFPQTLEACRQADRSQWAIGDALIVECGPPGDTTANNDSEVKLIRAKEEINANGFPYELPTLRQYRSVAHAFVLDVRTSSTSWWVHLVAGTPQMLTEIIQEAGNRRLTVQLARELKEQIQARQTAAPAQTTAPSPTATTTPPAAPSTIPPAATDTTAAPTTASSASTPNAPAPRRRSGGQQLTRAREIVRGLLANNQPYNRTALSEEYDISHAVFDAAYQTELAFEEGRQQGLREAVPIDISTLSENDRARLTRLETRLRRQADGEVERRVSEGVQRFLEDYTLPGWREALRQAEMIARSAHSKPLTVAEFQTLQWALHPDTTTAERRHEAFSLVTSKQAILRPNPEFRLTEGLPTTIAEWTARREQVRQRNSTRAQRNPN